MQHIIMRTYYYFHIIPWYRDDDGDEDEFMKNVLNFSVCFLIHYCALISRHRPVVPVSSHIYNCELRFTLKNKNMEFFVFKQ